MRPSQTKSSQPHRIRAVKDEHSLHAGICDPLYLQLQERVTKERELQFEQSLVGKNQGRQQEKYSTRTFI